MSHPLLFPFDSGMMPLAGGRRGLQFGRSQIVLVSHARRLLQHRASTLPFEFHPVRSLLIHLLLLLMLGLPALSQEILWSRKGVGARPNLTILGAEGRSPSLLLSSPFGNRVLNLKLSSGADLWTRRFAERIPYPTLPLTEAAIAQGDQGTIFALRTDSGQSLWERREPEPLDYPVAPPRFRASSVFTFSRRGLVRRVNKVGELVGQARQANSWGKKIARTVPLRSNQQLLTYLDESGRVASYNPNSVGQLELISLHEPSSRDRRVLSGALTTNGDGIWTVELPASLRAASLAQDHQLWRQRLSSDENLWSEDGKLLAVPTLLQSNLGEIEKATDVLVLTRHRVTVFGGSSGEVLSQKQLPSPAVTTPFYDSKQRRWWLLCERHLLALNEDLTWTSHLNPVVDTPFSAVVLDSTVVIGTLEGRVYSVKL